MIAFPSPPIVITCMAIVTLAFAAELLRKSCLLCFSLLILGLRKEVSKGKRLSKERLYTALTHTIQQLPLHSYQSAQRHQTAHLAVELPLLLQISIE